MLKYLSYPIVVHFPGFNLPNSKKWFEFLNQRSNSFFELKEATIITWNNKSKGPLEDSLDKMGVKYIVLGKDINCWNNVIKIKLTNEILDKISTKYVIGLDSCDVIVLDDPNKIVQRFKKMNCKILFNSQCYCYPRINQNGENHDFVEFEKKLNIKNYKDCYLNAGAWVGETEFCKKFFQKCENIFENNNFDKEKEIYWKISEQAYVRKAFMCFPDLIKLDYTNKIFKVVEDSI
jgi:hypothetical protein